MKKRLLLIWLLTVAMLSLPVLAEGPRLPQQIAEENKGKKVEEEKNKDARPYPFYELVVIVKTIPQNLCWPV